MVKYGDHRKIMRLKQSIERQAKSLPDQKHIAMNYPCQVKSKKLMGRK